MIKLNKNEKAALAAIANAPEGFQYVNPTNKETAALINLGLIELNPGIVDPTDSDKIAARVKPEGNIMTDTETVVSNETGFEILKGVELPPQGKRGSGGGAGKTRGSKYGFEKMEQGDSVFVPVSASMPDPVKTLASQAGTQNSRYAEQTGTKPGSVWAKGADGKKVKSDAGDFYKVAGEVPVYKYTRRYEVRRVEAGKTYGTWTAPADGALIARTL